MKSPVYPVVTIAIFITLSIILDGSNSVSASIAADTNDQQRNYVTDIYGVSGPPRYYEQIVCGFKQDFAYLRYSVSAVKQTNADGAGPCHWLNGLGDTGGWYQVGLSYNWDPMQTGFKFTYEVWSPDGISVFPNMGSGVLDFSDSVVEGDQVSLSLSISRGNVIMSAIDRNTGAHIEVAYTSYGATRFIGNKSLNGYATCLMTECWYTSPYYGGMKGVVFTSENMVPITSVWVEIAEGCWPSNWLFTDSTEVYFNDPLQLQVFTSHGAIAAVSAVQFITGVIPLPPNNFAPGGSGMPPLPAMPFTTIDYRQPDIEIKLITI